MNLIPSDEELKYDTDYLLKVLLKYSSNRDLMVTLIWNHFWKTGPRYWGETLKVLREGATEVAREEFKEIGGRVIEVVNGVEGYIYKSEDNGDGRLILRSLSSCYFWKVEEGREAMLKVLSGVGEEMVLVRKILTHFKDYIGL